MKTLKVGNAPKMLIICILLIVLIVSCSNADNKEAETFFNQSIAKLNVFELCIILVITGLLTRK